ncbi:MAG: GNAT family N-acetyltransferase [Ferruginibacter sp.]
MLKFMQEVNKNYTIVKGIADEQELENYRLCFQRNGTERDIKNLQWLHKQNQANTNTIFYAMDGNNVAAIYTALPVLFNLDGKIVPSLQSIDTMTDEFHRGKGLFIKLAAALYEDAATQKFGLVYGFPNENSAPGFFKKLKWTSFGEAPFMIKPLRLAYFLKKILNKKKGSDFSSANHIFGAPESVQLKNSYVIKAIGGFDENYNSLWNSARSSFKVGINRDASYMNWRYIQKPGEHYYRYGLFEHDQLKAVIVFSLKKKHDGLIGYVMELIFNPGDKKSAKAILKFATKIFRQQKTDVVLAWCFPHSFNYKSYKNAGYYNLPPKLRPQKLYLGVRAFNEADRSVIENTANWYISYSDSDTV